MGWVSSAGEGKQRSEAARPFERCWRYSQCEKQLQLIAAQLPESGLRRNASFTHTPPPPVNLISQAVARFQISLLSEAAQPFQKRLYPAFCMPNNRENNRRKLLHDRSHIRDQCLSLVLGNPFFFVSRHMRRFLEFSPLQYGLNMHRVGFCRIKLFLRFLSMTGDAFRFVSAGGVKLVV